MGIHLSTLKPMGLLLKLFDPTPGGGAREVRGYCQRVKKYFLHILYQVERVTSTTQYNTLWVVSKGKQICVAQHNAITLKP